MKSEVLISKSPIQRYVRECKKAGLYILKMLTADTQFNLGICCHTCCVNTDVPPAGIQQSSSGKSFR